MWLFTFLQFFFLSWISMPFFSLFTFGCYLPWDSLMQSHAMLLVRFGSVRLHLTHVSLAIGICVGVGEWYPKCIYLMHCFSLPFTNICVLWLPRGYAILHIHINVVTSSKPTTLKQQTERKRIKIVHRLSSKKQFGWYCCSVSQLFCTFSSSYSKFALSLMLTLTDVAFCTHTHAHTQVWLFSFVTFRNIADTK